MSLAPVLPGATIGFLGGGQLGRMTGLAALAMGYRVAVLDPDPAAPAAAVADHLVTAKYDDERAAATLAERCGVVTLEIEQISRLTIEAAARFAPVRPGAEPVWIIQDRGRQKEFLRRHGFPLGPFAVAENTAATAAAVSALGPSVVKSCFGGYDGRGQARVHDPAQGGAAFDEVGGRRVVVEQFLDIALECSVLVARQARTRTVAYAPAENHHDAGVLQWSVHPARLEPDLAEDAVAIATGIAEALGIEGLLAVEFFVLRDGRIVVNELAPRPHNSYHATERSCATSQFEQLIRSVCNLPLGSVEIVRPAAIMNLLGDVWEHPRGPDPAAALAVPGVRLHLYGKTAARAGRKMGHLSAIGATPDEALARAQQAYRAFARG